MARIKVTVRVDGSDEEHVYKYPIVQGQYPDDVQIVGDAMRKTIAKTGESIVQVKLTEES